MGEVVAFRMREKDAREGRAPPIGDAEILFFLGVRYARMEEPREARGTRPPDEDKGQGPRGGKKRKSRARA